MRPCDSHSNRCHKVSTKYRWLELTDGIGLRLPRSPDDPVLDGPWVAPCYFAEIYVAKADGSGLRRLTENSVDDRWPTWLPDGRIFFVSNRAGPQDLTNSDGSEYYVMYSDGTGVQRSRWNPSYS